MENRMNRLITSCCLLVVLWAVSGQAQQLKTWPKPAQFDGEKFAKRYGLTDRDFGVTVINGVEHVYVRDASKITDQTPIFEPSDAPKRIVTIDELVKRIEELEKRLGLRN